MDDIEDIETILDRANAFRALVDRFKIDVEDISAFIMVMLGEYKSKDVQAYYDLLAEIDVISYMFDADLIKEEEPVEDKNE